MTGLNASQNIILFDGVCNLCSNSVKFIIKRDKKALFKFAPLQSDIGIELLRKYDLTTQESDTVIYIRTGKALTRSTAALFVLKDLGGIWSGLFVFIVLPKFIRDFFYGLIAKSRYRIWGRKESCMIPDVDNMQRFL